MVNFFVGFIMSNMQVNRGLIFSGDDFRRPRMVVEKEKMIKFFPQFKFYGSNGQVTSVKGILTTNFKNSYLVRVYILREISIYNATDFFTGDHS